MAKDALTAHARDELGISEVTTARPIQAAFTSAATFTAGGVLPLLVAILAPTTSIIIAVSASSLAFLGLLGVIGARTGGAIPFRAAARVTFWGAMAMAVTAGIGLLVGQAV